MRVLIFVHFFSGRRRDDDIQSHLQPLSTKWPNLSVLSVDVTFDKLLGDIGQAHVRSFWCQMALGGYLVGWVAGPPCETWSGARLNDTGVGDGGPKALRDRNHPWGLPDAPPSGWEQRTVENLLLRFVCS